MVCVCIDGRSGSNDAGRPCVGLMSKSRSGESWTFSLPESDLRSKTQTRRGPGLRGKERARISWAVKVH